MRAERTAGELQGLQEALCVTTGYYSQADKNRKLSSTPSRPSHKLGAEKMSWKSEGGRRNVDYMTHQMTIGP